jgi:DNA-binding beta-propeller fold protein YncE
MNGVRENNIMVFDSTDPDPMKWKKKALVTQPHWRGAYPNTFHMGFTPDAKKVYVTLWWPSPTPNGVAVVDAVNWKVIKEIEVGPDAHTLGVTGDGKHVFGVISGYQKTTSGIYVIDVESDTLKGFLPSGQGHHDCVIIPRNKQELMISRSPTT